MQESEERLVPCIRPCMLCATADEAEVTMMHILSKDSYLLRVSALSVVPGCYGKKGRTLMLYASQL